ncbi:ribbon-helix-helix domain-containing protein [Telmatospirillum sp. J64-1]|uniref:ribbon-helix-helix domain-containing protein n=1 Tax=Telmatospirillum sp. J64-1 TaxID=2502183 RepID=UPI00115E140B|nr:ribbon-helix-helix domain-containing protein [Telmatospirillum sp. J64-1]
MCRLYASTPARDYERITRSVRLNSCVTSIRLERRFWQTLEELAREEELSLGQFLSRLHDEVLLERGEVGNFASLLRVVCLTFLTSRAAVKLQGDSVRPDIRIPS